MSQELQWHASLLWQVQSAAQVQSHISRLLKEQAQLQQKKERLQYSLAQDARAPKSAWDGTFGWSKRASELLQTTFGLSTFRSASAPDSAAGPGLAHATPTCPAGPCSARQSTALCQGETPCA